MYFWGLVFSWKSKLVVWLKNKNNLLKDIRKRKYFYITEKGYKTDLKKRRELGSAIYAFSNIGFIVLIMIFSVVTSLINYPLATGLFGIIINWSNDYCFYWYNIISSKLCNRNVLLYFAVVSCSFYC